MPGLGTDIIEIRRIATALVKPRFVQRVYTAQEQTALRDAGAQAPQRAAGLFCAKEAVAKALGTGFAQGLHLTDIEVTYAPTGAPQARVHGRDTLRVLLSISHCREYATATALVWEENA